MAEKASELTEDEKRDQAERVKELWRRAHATLKPEQVAGTDEWWAKLTQPFGPEYVRWRIDRIINKDTDRPRGAAVPYIDARAVMDRLDDVCTGEGWMTEMVGFGERVACKLSIEFMKWVTLPDGSEELRNTWVSKMDGAGATDYEGDKGAFSDALKRAAVHWGIGRHLYQLDRIWVDVEPRGNSFVIAEHEKDRLDEIIARGIERRQPQEEEIGPEVPSTPAPSQAGGCAPPAQRPASRPPAQQGRTASGDNNRAPVPPSRPRSQSGAPPKISQTSRKRVHKAGFQALENVGFSKQAIDALPPSEKFAPVDYAVSKLGKHRLDELLENEVEIALRFIAEWEQSEIGRKAQREAAQGDASMSGGDPEPGYYDDGDPGPNDQDW